MKSPKANRVRMPSATAVVARSYPDKIIGVDNDLPWRLSTDLRQFKRRTSGHVVVMGRKTYESIGRPLPNRMNIVLSRKKIPDEKNLLWADDFETALFLADVHSIMMGKKEFFVIGGENIYNVFEEFINKVVLTEVFSGSINGDAKFEFEFRENDEWYNKFEADFPRTEVDQFPFRVTIYMRRKPLHRFRMSRRYVGREQLDDQDLSRQFEILFGDEVDVPEENERQVLFDF